MRALAFAGVAAVGIAAAVGALAPAEPDLDRGAALYAEQCAACHGAALEGQANWREPTPEGRLRAPPHDATGHTWHHGDAVLFRIVKEGSAAVVGGGYQSDMPGFGDVLGDAEIRDVLAFIRSTWPEREAAYQAEMTRREGRGG
jgi:mono/diheme cytochrome c family protein